MKKNCTLIILLAVSTSLLISSCQKSDKTEANRIVSTKASLEESVEIRQQINQKSLQQIKQE